MNDEFVVNTSVKSMVHVLLMQFMMMLMQFMMMLTQLRMSMMMMMM